MINNIFIIKNNYEKIYYNRRRKKTYNGFV